MPIEPPEIRYSPRPRTSYCALGRTGPVAESLYDRPEVWNLAYLSHDFDRLITTPDSQFAVHVRKTCQFDVRRWVIDRTFGAAGNFKDLLAYQLRMPAPYFVRWLKQRRYLLPYLPLYQAYGEEWLGAIENRARVCHVREDPVEPLITDLTQARQHLQRISHR